MSIIIAKSGIETTGAGRYAIGLATAWDIPIQFVSDPSALWLLPDGIVIVVGFIPSDFCRYMKKGVKYYYIYCSSFLQAELSSGSVYSPEIMLAYELNSMIQSGGLFGVITTSKSMAWTFQNWHWCPPYRVAPENAGLNRCTERSGFSMIGNLSRKHKNVCNSLAAIGAFPNSVVYMSSPEGFRGLQDMFDVKLEKFAYGDDYFTQIAKHHMCLQCDVAGTFSYIALEYAIVGVPTICSNFIDWYPIEDCFVNNIDSPEEIFTAINRVRENYWDISDKIWLWAQEYQYDTKILLEEKKKDVL